MDPASCSRLGIAPIGRQQPCVRVYMRMTSPPTMCRQSSSRRQTGLRLKAFGCRRTGHQVGRGHLDFLEEAIDNFAGMRCGPNPLTGAQKGYDGSSRFIGLPRSQSPPRITQILTWKCSAAVTITATKSKPSGATASSWHNGRRLELVELKVR